MFHKNIAETILQNSDYRNVLYTTDLSQIVAMSLKPSQDVGLEIHQEHDQIFFVFEGHAQALVDGQSLNLNPNDMLVVNAGSEHNITNVGQTDLKLCTIYTPPTHLANTHHHTKEDALADPHEH